MYGDQRSGALCASPLTSPTRAVRGLNASHAAQRTPHAATSLPAATDVFVELIASLRATAEELTAVNRDIGTSSESQTSELRLFKREAERLMAGFVTERTAEAARLNARLAAATEERRVLAAALFKPVESKYWAEVAGTSLLERLASTGTQIWSLENERRASVAQLSAARSRLCAQVGEQVSKKHFLFFSNYMTEFLDHFM